MLTINSTQQFSQNSSLLASATSR